MELRLKSADAPLTVSIDEFKELIRAGKVEPTALYREVWTGGEWRTVDTLPLYRRMTAPDYSYEAELKEEKEFFARREKQRQRQQEIEALIGPLSDMRDAELESGDLIERSYGACSLLEAGEEPDTTGIARLLVLPSFEPETVFTFRFQSSCISIEALQGDNRVSKLLEDIQRRACETGDQQELRNFRYPFGVSRGEAQLEYRDAPEPFRSWVNFTNNALRLESCETLAFDGIGYLQKILHQGEVHTVKWSNPTESSCLEQFEMVESYFECLSKTMLFDIFMRHL